MARPKRSEQRAPIDDRLKQALFDCIVERGFAETCVSDITEIVGCNRGTFYYYFKDLYELRDAVIDDNIPKDLPKVIFNLFLDQRRTDAEITSDVQPNMVQPLGNDSLFEDLMREGIRANSEKIESTALLLNSDIGDVVSKRIEHQAIEIWSSLLGIKEDELNASTRIVLGFLIGGLLNILAFRAQAGFEDEILEIVSPLTPEIPIALFACLERSMSDRFDIPSSS